MIYKKWLFVPATEKKLAKSDELRADALIYDLEDSIREEEKDAALQRVCKKLEKADLRERYVRVNAGPRMPKELERLQSLQCTGYWIPKVEGALTNSIANCTKGKKVFVIIETISALRNLEQIAASQFVDGIAFGGEDYCRELGVPTNELAMQYAREKIIVACKFYRKCCIDTICMEYESEEIFRSEFKKSLAMGFDSKMLIHPTQLKVVEKLEEEIDIDELKSIVSRFAEASDGMAWINGRWYEKPQIETIKATIAKWEAEKDAR